jgi:hypothetical protein
VRIIDQSTAEVRLLLRNWRCAVIEAPNGRLKQRRSLRQ